jgi:hypothetical protein
VGTGGYSGGLNDTSFLRQLTKEAGPVGPRAAIEAMGYIWFITDNAIYAFAPQLDNQLTVLGKPLSAAIQPVMDRMSAKYARGACVERWGYRLYFALPISAVPVTITRLTVELKTTMGLVLPFTLPTTLSVGAVATYGTTVNHGLSVGDKIMISGLALRQFNGEFEVLSVPDGNSFTVALEASETPAVGSNVTVTKIATRNNTIAVYNLNCQAWESIDTLPEGFYADWLRTADYGTRRRLWVIDATSGPALYEEGAADEIGTLIGGLTLPFTLPVQLRAARYATAPIPGRFRTRAMRWGAMPRKVRSCEVRAALGPEDVVTLSLLARTPNNRVWQGDRTFQASQFATTDVPLRKMSGERALEAQVEINVTSGRPTFRSVMVETANVGKVPE